MGLGGKEHIENQEDRTDGDGRVGYVKSRPAVGAEEDFEKIGDAAVNDAIRYVAGGSAQEQGKTSGIEGAEIPSAYQQPGDYGDDGYGSHDQKDAQDGRGGAREQAEGYPWIFGMDQVNEIVDDFVAPGFRGLRFDPGLGEAVEEDDGQGEPDPAEARREFHG